jgi:hypothetical protein
MSVNTGRRAAPSPAAKVAERKPKEPLTRKTGYSGHARTLMDTQEK